MDCRAASSKADRQLGEAQAAHILESQPALLPGDQTADRWPRNRSETSPTRTVCKPGRDLWGTGGPSARAAGPAWLGAASRRPHRWPELGTVTVRTPTVQKPLRDRASLQQ